MKLSLRVTTLIIAVLALARNACGQGTFQVLEPFPNTNSGSLAWSASPDGRTMIGNAGNGNPVRVGRWQAGQGFEDLTPSFGPAPYYTTSASAAGDVIAGTRNDVAIRWTESSGVQSLGFLPTGRFSQASGLSGDGSVVVGSSDTDDGRRAFRWTPGNGMAALLPPTAAEPQQCWGNGVSRDGRIVIGSSGNFTSGGYAQAVRWLPDGTPQALGRTSNTISSQAYVASVDGSVITGNLIVSTPANPFGVSHVFGWTEGMGGSGGSGGRVGQ